MNELEKQIQVVAEVRQRAQNLKTVFGGEMTTETKVNKLMKLVDRQLDEALLAVEEARVAKATALKVSSVLPEELLAHTWWRFEKKGDGWYMETSILSDAEANEFIRALKLCGVTGIKSSYRGYANKWAYSGTFQVGNETIEIMVDGGSQPPTCRVEKIVEMKEVTTYKAICEETGEVL
ncbi:hypothetical protein LCGC14_1578050 [marine sediment metagenome]|uniref:Uncharacterized protein n=1 Tax=marine sediment metagenome TaxID=412755 RepID=A0A0F9LHZ2_9ZZZZ